MTVPLLGKVVAVQSAVRFTDKKRHVTIRIREADTKEFQGEDITIASDDYNLDDEFDVLIQRRQ